MLVRLSGCRSAEEAADLLMRWNRIQPDDVLFATANWFAVKIYSVDGTSRYSTYWEELSPARLLREVADGQIGAIVEALSTFSTVSASKPPKSEEAKQSLLDQLADYFEREGWPYLRLDDQSALQCAYQGASATWTCFARVREEQRFLMFYSVCPVQAPESRHDALAEFITRANYGLIIGNFELDLDDGELRYKTSIDVADGPLMSSTLRRVIAANVQTLDRYLPGIFMVISGELLPVDAIARVEGSS
jgi:hypothetical protein